MYKTIKGSFRQEPFITKILNRYQRSWLSQFRISAHSLRVERGHYTVPLTPLSQWICVYCDSGECDTERHAIMLCRTFNLKRQRFLWRVAAIVPNFMSMTSEQYIKLSFVQPQCSLGNVFQISWYLIDNGRQQKDLQICTKHRLDSW